MNNKKQTAVEWYSDKLGKILGDMCNEFTQEQTLANHYALRQAKQMEKEQHENTWYAGDEDGAIHEFEYYWEETYGGNK